jgi:hypothetical protein
LLLWEPGYEAALQLFIVSASQIFSLSLQHLLAEEPGLTD